MSLNLMQIPAGYRQAGDLAMRIGQQQLQQNQLEQQQKARALQNMLAQRRFQLQQNQLEQQQKARALQNMLMQKKIQLQQNPVMARILGIEQAQKTGQITPELASKIKGTIFNTAQKSNYSSPGAKIAKDMIEIKRKYEQGLISKEEYDTYKDALSLERKRKEARIARDETYALRNDPERQSEQIANIDNELKNLRKDPVNNEAEIREKENARGNLIARYAKMNNTTNNLNMAYNLARVENIMDDVTPQEIKDYSSYSGAKGALRYKADSVLASINQLSGEQERRYRNVQNMRRKIILAGDAIRKAFQMSIEPSYVKEFILPLVDTNQAATSGGWTGLTSNPELSEKTWNIMKKTIKHMADDYKLSVYREQPEDKLSAPSINPEIAKEAYDTFTQDKEKKQTKRKYTNIEKLTQKFSQEELEKMLKERESE